MNDYIYPVTKYTGKEIKSLRLDLQISQVEFGYVFGVTSGQISKWERDTQNPSKTAYRLIFAIKKYGINCIS